VLINASATIPRCFGGRSFISVASASTISRESLETRVARDEQIAQSNEVENRETLLPARRGVPSFQVGWISWLKKSLDCLPSSGPDLDSPAVSAEVRSKSNRNSRVPAASCSVRKMVASRVQVDLIKPAVAFCLAFGESGELSLA